MARLSSVVISYFVMGAVMWGAGILDTGTSLGVVDIFFNVGADGTVAAAEQPETLLGQVGSTVGDVAGGLIGPILAVWTALREIIGVLFWPVTALVAINAPPEVVVLAGGTPTVAFFMGVIRTIRESA
jgi:hypothetical protein